MRRSPGVGQGDPTLIPRNSGMTFPWFGVHHPSKGKTLVKIILFVGTMCVVIGAVGCIGSVKRVYERRTYAEANTQGKNHVSLECTDQQSFAEDPRIEDAKGVVLGEAACADYACSWPVVQGSGTVSLSMRCGTEE